VFLYASMEHHVTFCGLGEQGSMANPVTKVTPNSVSPRGYLPEANPLSSRPKRCATEGSAVFSK